MSDTTLNSIIGLVGVVIGWGLNRLTVTHTMKKQEFYKAAATFRLAFTDEIRILRNTFHPENMGSSFVLDTLTAASAKHENSFIAFRPYLSVKERRKFDDAWKDYRCPEGGDPASDPSPLIDYYGDGGLDLVIKMALEKMETLVRFAKHA
jgi:hypothetical protein